MLAGRMFAALVLAGTAVLAAATPALAHTELKSSDPAKGAKLAVAPQQVHLTFGEAVQLTPEPIKVTGPNGTQWTVGPATMDGAVVTAPVTPTGPAGAYTITYKVIADDGDAVNGTIKFTLTAAVPPPPAATTPPSETSTTTSTTTPAPASSPSSGPAVPQPTPAAQQTTDSGGVPVWIWIVGALILVGVGVFVGVRARNSKSPAE